MAHLLLHDEWKYPHDWAGDWSAVKHLEWAELCPCNISEDHWEDGTPDEVVRQIMEEP